MNGDAILQLADRAARSVRKRHSLNWTREDFEDARQEAAAGIVRALRDRPQMPEAYYMRAGMNGATRSAFRTTSIRAQRLTLPDGHDDETGTPITSIGRAWSRRLGDADFPRLRRLLSVVPRKTGARGGPKTRDQLAVARDLIILEALSDGCTRSAIGERLGLRKTAVDAYIDKLKKRLSALAEEVHHGYVAV